MHVVLWYQSDLVLHTGPSSYYRNSASILSQIEFVDVLSSIGDIGKDDVFASIKKGR